MKATQGKYQLFRAELCLLSSKSWDFSRCLFPRLQNEVDGSMTFPATSTVWLGSHIPAQKRDFYSSVDEPAALGTVISFLQEVATHSTISKWVFSLGSFLGSRADGDMVEESSVGHFQTGSILHSHPCFSYSIVNAQDLMAFRIVIIWSGLLSTSGHW